MRAMESAAADGLSDPALPYGYLSKEMERLLALS